VNFPVAVYNYLDTAQTVRSRCSRLDWFTSLGATGMDIDLGPGQVTGVRFPVRVDKVGRQTMTVKGTGGTVFGRRGSLGPGGSRRPGGSRGHFRRARCRDDHQHGELPCRRGGGLAAALPQRLSGLPVAGDWGDGCSVAGANGCFEQTTSTAWPNVLVTAYLKQTKQLKPEIQLKAESLMSAGYQRLLTFEHAAAATPGSASKIRRPTFR